jgi:hypothetical protein
MDAEQKSLSPAAIVAWSAIVTVALGLFVGTLLKPKGR